MFLQPQYHFYTKEHTPCIELGHKSQLWGSQVVDPFLPAVLWEELVQVSQPLHWKKRSVINQITDTVSTATLGRWDGVLLAQQCISKAETYAGTKRTFLSFVIFSKHHDSITTYHHCILPVQCEHKQHTSQHDALQALQWNPPLLSKTISHQLTEQTTCDVTKKNTKGAML